MFARLGFGIIGMSLFLYLIFAPDLTPEEAYFYDKYPGISPTQRERRDRARGLLNEDPDEDPAADAESDK